MELCVIDIADEIFKSIKNKYPHGITIEKYANGKTEQIKTSIPDMEEKINISITLDD